MLIIVVVYDRDLGGENDDHDHNFDEGERVQPAGHQRWEDPLQAQGGRA